MQRLSGVLMVLAGTALGGYMVLPAPQNSAERLAEVTRISAAPDRSPASSSSAVGGLVTSANAQASPPLVKAPPVAAATLDPSTGARVFSPDAPLAAPAANAAPVSAATSTWTAVVTSEPAANGKMSSPRPGDAGTRAALASDLQRELKRVGCYGGDITGTWTQSSKKAMSAFMERVNATLPVDEPDYILLTLVQGHAAIACGAECPTGQVQSGAGRCVPQAVVAQASRKSQREDDRRANEERKAQQQERLALEQRTAEAKRIADTNKAADAARTEANRVAAAQKAAEAQRIAAAAVTPPAPKPAIRPAAAPVEAQVQAQQTAAVAPERLPWLADEAAAPAAETRAAPLPGMMSIGGPRVFTPETQASITGASTTGASPDRAPRPSVTVIEDLLETPAAAATSTAPRVIRVAPTQPTVVRQAALPGMPGSKSGVAERRPVVMRQAAISGMPGTKSGVAGMPGTKSGVAAHSVVRNQLPVVTKYRPAKIVRRPPPVIVYTPKAKSYSYASSSGGKSRRGQPRPGSMHYNVMHSLGGIY